MIASASPNHCDICLCQHVIANQHVRQPSADKFPYTILFRQGLSCLFCDSNRAPNQGALHRHGRALASTAQGV